MELSQAYVAYVDIELFLDQSLISSELLTFNTDSLCTTYG